jgi:hypothetical protein
MQADTFCAAMCFAGNNNGGVDIRNRSISALDYCIRATFARVAHRAHEYVRVRGRAVATADPRGKSGSARPCAAAMLD